MFTVYTVYTSGRINSPISRATQTDVYFRRWSDQQMPHLPVKNKKNTPYTH